MGDTVTKIFVLALRFGLFTSIVALWIGMITIMIANILVPVNGSLITDLLALAQVWLPFHVASLVAWLLGTVSAFITYKVAKFGYNLLQEFSN